MRTATAILTVAALAATLTGCGGPNEPAPAPAQTTQAEPAAPAKQGTRVSYQVRGDTPTADLTLATQTGVVQHADAAVADEPIGYWRDEAVLASGEMAYVSVQASSDANEVTCIILIAGQEVARNTSTGAYSIATCEAVVP